MNVQGKQFDPCEVRVVTGQQCTKVFGTCVCVCKSNAEMFVNGILLQEFID